jgi:phenylalanyl-tRNA synthetase alpha subunit
MVDPNVLKTAESIPKNITVLHLNGNRAIAMLLYQIGDIRMFYENDVF